MPESEAVRWLQLAYKVPSEPSQKRVWVWRRLQNLGAYALQNSVYLLPFSEEVEKHFQKLAQDIRGLGGEATIFSIVAIDENDERRILHTLQEARTTEYNAVASLCARFLARAAHMLEAQRWNEQVHHEFAQALEKVHVLFRSARRHDLLGPVTATKRACAAEAMVACEQVLRVLLDNDYGKARRLLELHHELYCGVTDMLDTHADTSTEQETAENEKS